MAPIYNNQLYLSNIFLPIALASSNQYNLFEIALEEMPMFSVEQLSSFNDLDYLIYNFIIENPAKIPYMTIRELAAETHVSTASITRFAKKVGCGGFTEFKLLFKKEQTQTETEIIDDISVAEAFFARAKETNFQKKLDETAQVLADARMIICVGTGNSGVMAIYAARYFSSLGKFAVNVDNPMFAIDIPTSSDTVFIFFSVSGEMFLKTLPLIKASEAKIISITNSRNNPLAKISDFNLAYYVQQEKKTIESYEYLIDTTTQIPVIYMIEVLAKKVRQLMQ